MRSSDLTISGCETIVCWTIKNKEICFFLRKGKMVTYDNVIDVMISPKPDSSEESSTSSLKEENLSHEPR
jgi:hypothetical protein